MIFCVFSFNRAEFLKNCIASIESCAPGAGVIVFDDNSTDPETIDVLRDIGYKHSVKQPGHASRHHLGGLYGNMQSALEVCADEELVCFLQDDTQLVRAVSDEDIAAIETCFESMPDLGFISPCFIKGMNVDRGKRYDFDAQSRLYFMEPNQRSSGRFFSALCIMKPKRLLRQGWSFEASEPLNNQQAEKLFRSMGYLFAPIAHWLPEVPSYRRKRKTVGLRLAEKRRGCGFYPFKLMSQEQLRALKQRADDVLPVAEDHLECFPKTPKKPWNYSALSGAGWMKTLNQLEVSLRRLFSSKA